MSATIEYLEAIERRRSVRSYTADPIEDRQEERLKSLIDRYNREGLLSISWLEDGSGAFTALKSYGMFRNVRSVIVLKGPSSTADLRERIGYYGELLVLEATTMGLGTCWIAGTYDRKSKLFRLQDDEKLVALVSVGNISPTKSLKERLISGSVTRRKRPTEWFYTADGEVPRWFAAGIEAVAKAPSAVNSQRVRFSYANGMAGATVPGNRPTDLIDLGIAKLHFSLAAGGTFPFGPESRFEKA
jgi:hypothetical protein